MATCGNNWVMNAPTTTSAAERGALVRGTRDFALESRMLKGEPVPQRRRLDVDDLERRLPPLIDDVALLVQDTAAAHGRRPMGMDTRAHSRVLNPAGSRM